MTETGQLLETLNRDQLQHTLERFSALIPFPLGIVNTAGTCLTAVNVPNANDIHALRWCVNSVRYVLTEAPNQPYRILFSVPVFLQDEVIGYVIVWTEHESSESSEQYAPLVQLAASAIGEKAYAEYELKDLTEELIEKYNEITVIYEISEALGAVLDPKTVCAIILKKAVEVVGVGKASIMLYDEQLNQLYIAAAHGFDLSEVDLREIRVIPGQGISGKVFATGQHILVEDANEQIHPDLSLRNRSYKKNSFLSIPMIFSSTNMEKRVMGVINMTDKISSELFTSGDLRLLTTIASQAAMSLYNIRLIEEVKDAERVRHEMEIAQQIQMGLLPDKPPEVSGLEIAGRCLPATQVGGDYYDFILNADTQKVSLVIADVSGHNVGAALMMAAARSALRSEILAQKSPAAILENTNLTLYQDLTRAELFITMFYAEYDTTTRVLRYSNGGHNYPIVLRNGACAFLNTEGMLIGVLESASFEEGTICLDYDDFVVFYTDGVVEAKNAEGAMFSVDRLCQVLETADRQWSANALLERIYETVEQYSGNAFRSDDITVMIMKIQQVKENGRG